MALGKRIRTLREQQGLSQDDLANITEQLVSEGQIEASVSQGAISALEKRDSSTSKHAGALAKALGVEIGELYGQDNYQFSQQMRAHIKVMQSLPSYARDEVIRDAIKTAELIERAKSENNGTKKQ